MNTLCYTTKRGTLILGALKWIILDYLGGPSLITWPLKSRTFSSGIKEMQQKGEIWCTHLVHPLLLEGPQPHRERGKERRQLVGAKAGPLPTTSKEIGISVLGGPQFYKCREMHLANTLNKLRGRFKLRASRRKESHANWYLDFSLVGTTTEDSVESCCTQTFDLQNSEMINGWWWW